MKTKEGMVKVNINHFTQLLSFELGQFMAQGLLENYPDNFNKLIPEMAKSIAEKIVLEDKYCLSEQTKVGLAHARARGVKLGRPSRVDIKWVLDLRGMGCSLSQIAKEVKCDRSTISKLLKRNKA